MAKQPRRSWSLVLHDSGTRIDAYDGTAWRVQVSREASRRWHWRAWHVLRGGSYASGFQPTMAKAIALAKRVAEEAAKPKGAR